MRERGRAGALALKFLRFNRTRLDTKELAVVVWETENAVYACCRCVCLSDIVVAYRQQTWCVQKHEMEFVVDDVTHTMLWSAGITNRDFVCVCVRLSLTRIAALRQLFAGFCTACSPYCYMLECKSNGVSNFRALLRFWKRQQKSSEGEWDDSTVRAYHIHNDNSTRMIDRSFRLQCLLE